MNPLLYIEYLLPNSQCWQIIATKNFELSYLVWYCKTQIYLDCIHSCGIWMFDQNPWRHLTTESFSIRARTLYDIKYSSQLTQSSLTIKDSYCNSTYSAETTSSWYIYNISTNSSWAHSLWIIRGFQAQLSVPGAIMQGSKIFTLFPT